MVSCHVIILNELMAHHHHAHMDGCICGVLIGQLCFKINIMYLIESEFWPYQTKSRILHLEFLFLFLFFLFIQSNYLQSCCTGPRHSIGGCRPNRLQYWRWRTSFCGAADIDITNIHNRIWTWEWWVPLIAPYNNYAKSFCLHLMFV